MRFRLRTLLMQFFFGPPTIRFTIRDLLWLTTVLAVVVGWGVDRRSFARRVIVNFQPEEAALLPGEVFEIKALPDGKFSTRTVPAPP